MFTALLSLAAFGAMPMLSDDPPRPLDPPGDRQAPAQGAFEKFDRNNDGVLDREEFQHAMKQARKRIAAAPRDGDAERPARPDVPRRAAASDGEKGPMPPQCSPPQENRRTPRWDRARARSAAPPSEAACEMRPRSPDGPMLPGRGEGPRWGQRDQKAVEHAVARTMKRHRSEIDRMVNKLVREAMRELHSCSDDGMPVQPPGRQGAFCPRVERGPAVGQRPREERRIDRQMQRFDADRDGRISRDEFRGPPGPRERPGAGVDGRQERRGSSRPLPPRQQQDEPSPEPDELEE